MQIKQRLAQFISAGILLAAAVGCDSEKTPTLPSWIGPISRSAAPPPPSPPPQNPVPAPLLCNPTGQPWSKKFGPDIPSTRDKAYDVYIPARFCPIGGKYDLIAHFFGAVPNQHRNMENANMNAIVVSVNLGIASDKYATAFNPPHAFDALLNQTQEIIDEGLAKTSRPAAQLNRIALESWSAGFQGVSAVIMNPGDHASQIDAVLLADGLHTLFKNGIPRKINTNNMDKWVALAEAAENGGILFGVTHSSIFPEKFIGTTETAEYILQKTGVPKGPPGPPGPGKMRSLYEAHRGDFHVKGFYGQDPKDHIAQIVHMGETLYPYLRVRWQKQPAPTP